MKRVLSQKLNFPWGKHKIEILEYFGKTTEDFGV